MKISKVNNIRAAVSAEVQGMKDVQGVLYKDPKNISEENPIRIDDQYEKLIKPAKRLYSVLNPEKQETESSAEKEKAKDPKKTREAKEAQKRRNEARKDINSLINILLKLKPEPTSSEGIDYLVERQFAKLSGKEIVDCAKELRGKGEEIKELFRRYTRKSLKKVVRVNDDEVYIPDVMTELFLGWAEGKNYYDIPRRVGTEKVKAFLRVLDNDYFKPGRKQQIEQSIKRQKTHIGITKLNGGYYLVPANHNHIKKNSDGSLKSGYSKKAVFDFMKKFAGSDVHGQKRMLVEIRALIVLYLCGEETYKDVLDNYYGLTEKTFGSVFSGELFFSDSVNVKIVEKESLEKEMKDLSSQEIEVRKIRIKDIKTEITVALERAFQTHFREAKAAVGNSASFDSDLFWIHYFDRIARGLLLSNTVYPSYKIEIKWLADHMWGIWCAYIATKFVEYGKAVYHFVMPEIDEIKTKNVSFGEVQEEYRNGISSFEYERIKAMEDLDKSVACSVSFAANALSRSVIKVQKEELDILNGELPYPTNEQANRKKKIKKNEQKKINSGNLYEEAGIRVLRYFGGVSRWKENSTLNIEKLSENCGKAIVEPLRKQLIAIRNESFHYSTTPGIEDEGLDFIEKMYEFERTTFGDLIRDKYYSNNTYLFYETKQIKKLLTELYNKNSSVPAQIPSFSKLFNRNSLFSDSHLLTAEARERVGAFTPDEVKVFKGAFFFVLKEIYYRAFLQDPYAKNRFDKMRRSSHSVANTYAQSHFNKRVDLIRKDATLGEVCQEVMTDFELFNQEKKVNSDKETYKHYRDLLYVYMRESFVDYLLTEEEKFGFLLNPQKIERTSVLPIEAFCKGWKTDIYPKLYKEDKGVLKWYVLGHFLAPRQLNHLIGSFKSYIVYLENIDRRAEDLRNRKDSDHVQKEKERIEKIIWMLGFVQNYCGRTSNKIEDYFKDKQEYRAWITKLTDLQDEQVKGLYFDEINPIANRNIILASMYGNLQIICAACTKVTEKDIKIYSNLKQRLEWVFQKGFCENKNEQSTLRAYQNLKNKIEFRDVLTYTEISADLQGQLVAWSYYRERDLMYFQLGFFYTKLFFTDAVGKEDLRRKIEDGEVIIQDGAILYQIMALYSYALQLYIRVDGKKGKQISAKIGGFIGTYKQAGLPDVYTDGLFLFENIDEHDDIIVTRNYIDHFKYYAEQKRSLLELYSEIYDRFFSYSENFMKSVSYILPNILERYFVDARLSFDKKGEKSIKINGINKVVSATSIKVTKLYSSDLHYKLNNKTEVVLIPARTTEFLDNVKKILNYKAEGENHESGCN